MDGYYYFKIGDDITSDQLWDFWLMTANWISQKLVIWSNYRISLTMGKRLATTTSRVRSIYKAYVWLMATQTNATELLDNAQIAIKISHTFESPCFRTVSKRTSKKHTQKGEDSKNK